MNGDSHAAPSESPTTPTLSVDTSARLSAESQLDAVLREAGVADPKSVTDQLGWRWITLGSVTARIAIIEAEQTLFLRVIVPVMDLPSDRELILPLMRELLERNVPVAGSARFGLDRNGVVVASALPMISLTNSEVRAAIDNAAMMANEADEELIGRYGGTTKVRE